MFNSYIFGGLNYRYKYVQQECRHLLSIYMGHSHYTTETAWQDFNHETYNSLTQKIT